MRGPAWRRSWWRGSWWALLFGCSVAALSRWGGGPPVHDSASRAPLQDFERRQRLALQHLEECPAAGGDVADVLLDAVLGDRRQRIAAAGDAERGAGSDRARDRLGAFGERIELEDADR